MLTLKQLQAFSFCNKVDIGWFMRRYCLPCKAPHQIEFLWIVLTGTGFAYIKIDFVHCLGKVFYFRACITLVCHPCINKYVTSGVTNSIVFLFNVLIYPQSWKVFLVSALEQKILHNLRTALFIHLICGQLLVRLFPINWNFKPVHSLLQAYFRKPGWD